MLFPLRIFYAHKSPPSFSSGKKGKQNKWSLYGRYASTTTICHPDTRSEAAAAAAAVSGYFFSCIQSVEERPVFREKVLHGRSRIFCALNGLLTLQIRVSFLVFPSRAAHAGFSPLLYSNSRREGARKITCCATRHLVLGFLSCR